MNTEFKHWFTNDECQFLAHLSRLARQGEAEGTDDVYFDMEAAGERFDEVHGDGSVRSIFDRINQALALERERSASLRRCVMRVLGPQIGDLATWLNEADAALLESMGITL